MSKIEHLVDYFVPENYKLDMKISKPKRQFGGTVVITGHPLADQIKINAKNLTIKSLSTDTNPQPDWQQNGDIITVSERASQITIEFSGKFSETAMNGLYLCKYKIDGQSHELFATQFESHYAREAFPCIDEPAAKATFDLSITSDDPDDTVILSNMPGQLVDGTWQFATTPRMSTYLLAFVGGNLISKSGHTDRGTAINVYATAAQSKDSLDHALATATKCVEFYEKYFDVNYPLPKLDNVALPDFSAGAMENWGLITYRETCLLANSSAAEQTREYIASVIAHEIAHQWFGDLVTMKWWNDLWLNESFASLMEGIVLESIHPEYHVWEDFEIGDVSAALHRDALPGVQSVQQEVKSPDEIATLFDSAIVYAKGERLLKMLRAYIGEDAFRSGLTNYFNQHQYNNAIADDLWSALAASSQTNVKVLMDPWLTRPGYPVIYADMDGRRLTLEQKPFSLTGNTGSPDKIWPLPLFAGDKLPSIMQTRRTIIELPDSNPIQLNHDDEAHFIVKYDNQTFDLLVNNFSQLNVIDKIKLLRESLLLSQAELQNISHSLELLSHVADESNQAILATAAGLLGSFRLLVDIDSPIETKLKQLTRQIFDPAFNRLFVDIPTKQRTLNDIKAIGLILGRSVYADNDAAIEFCQSTYTSHRHNVASIDGNIRPAVLSAVISHGSADIFDELWQLYQTSNDADLRQDICAGLTSTRNTSSIKILLNSLTDTDLVRPQDTFYFVIWLIANPYARTATWCWLRNNWGWIEQVFGGDMSYDTFINAAGSSLRTDSELQEYDDFFARLNGTAMERVVKLGHRNIKSRISWIKHNKPILAEYLNNHSWTAAHN